MAVLLCEHKAGGGSGIEPRWTRSDEDGVGTAYSASSLVWFTVSKGILNEVYYLTIDQSQVRDLQYLVTDGETFICDERHLENTHECLAPHTLDCRLTNTDPKLRYRIVKEVIAAPHQDCVLPHTRLEADAGMLAKLRVFALLAPHLRQALDGAQRPLHYLAIPPSLFATVAEGLAQSGSARNARVVVEKLFGRDLASARELNRVLHAYFPEQAVFRIDHYLGKEPVQNLVYFRFTNAVIEAGWDNRHVESVQITVAESFGVADSDKFYEEIGAIRDVVQNHKLQVIACLAMECPAGKGHEALRDERGRLLQALRTLGPSDVVRGQFRGCRQEPGVSSESQVETFAAVRFFIDNARWEGMPFFVCAGKCLPVMATEVLVRFRHPTRPVLDETMPPTADYYRVRLSPEVVLALGLGVKQPGELLTGEGIELIARHQAADEMQSYERLLVDAVDGDATLFAREDSVEAAWRVVDPVLGNVTALYQYEAGTWGPPEADRLPAPEGGRHNLKPEEVLR